MTVTCAFCHAEVPEAITWQSKVDPANHYCNDELACRKQWFTYLRQVPDIPNKGTT